MAVLVTAERRGEILKECLTQLKRMGGHAVPRDVLAGAAEHLDLTEAELSRTSSGQPRWETFVRFYSVACVRAGWLQKTGGEWVLTPAGENALSMPGGELLRVASRLYRAARAVSPESTDAVEDEEASDDNSEDAERQAGYETAKEQARAGIAAHLDKLEAYDFQNLVAELLRAMQYHVAFVAPPGPDGGADVIAYRDPLGAQPPRIQVQVKHRTEKAAAKDVRELQGLLRRESDIGIFVSSAGFTSEAVREARNSARHLELIDQDRLIQLWTVHYVQISEVGRALLPLLPLHFLAPIEQ